MSIMHSEYRERLAHWLRTLAMDLYRPLGEIAFEGFCTMDHLTPAEAAQGPFAPAAVGEHWGSTWEYRWLRACITLPEEARGCVIAMDLNPGGESTIFVNGRPFGTRRADWIEAPHHYMVDNVLTWAGEPGEQFDLLVEAYAGHDFPGCQTGPILPGSAADPLQEGRRAALGRSTFGIWNEDAYQLYMDVTVLQQLLEEVPENSLRAAKIADGLEAFTNAVDFEQAPAARDADYRRARELLRPLMEAENGDTVPTMWAVGNAHLDLAWLWPMQETHRKTARTFAAQLRLLERYPDYRYIQSQPAAYEMCGAHYPALYEQIVQAVREGRWIAEGAMYVEPDTNMPSGEALVRQLVYGKRFYKEAFGIDSRILWLPDTFGYSAVLPQLLAGCGVDYLVTQKIFWSYNEGDPFPYHYFAWQGMDGTKVTSFLPTSYTYRTDPKEICGIWKGRVQKRGLEDFLVPYGYGDGGGGPCRDHIEALQRAENLEGMPRARSASPLDFFEDLDRRGGPRNTWTGELYFNAHRGTYTTQAAIKRNNRRSEFALHELELWGSLAQVKAGAAYPKTTAERLWKQLLLHQFHDILPGSSIARVYEEANAAHEALQKEAAALTAQACASLTAEGEGFIVFNPLGFGHTALVDLPAGWSGARLTNGELLHTDGKHIRVPLLPLGYVTVCPAEAITAVSVDAREMADGFVLESACARVAINRRGEVTEYVVDGRRMDAGVPMNVLKLWHDVPRKFDAWDIDSNYRDIPPETVQVTDIRIVQAAGLAAAVEWTGTIGHSAVRQTIRLEVDAPTLIFETTVDWHELHRLLKVEFPVDVYAENALHEMQFGFVERPVHESRGFDQQRFEVCNHRWTALADNSHGCAVLNDCKYGVSARGNTIALSLLRAAAAPEMGTDQGAQTFRYGLTAWNGTLMESGLPQTGLRFNLPVSVLPGCAGEFSLAQVSAPNVIIDTVKPADDGSGDLILRLYEALHADTFFALKLALPGCVCVPCDLLEQETGVPCDPANLHLRAFEVLTLRVKPCKAGRGEA